jgi:hypothetical protein
MPHQTTTLLTALLWGCTPNFWSLRTGVQGGELSGDVETALTYGDGCNDLTVYAMNDAGTALLMLSMSGPIERMSDENRRLETLLVSAEEDFTLTLQTGQDLYRIPCGYDSYYWYDSDSAEQPDGGVQQTWLYESGDIRMTLTGQGRRWDYYDDPVHVKLTLQDVVLADPVTGQVVTLDGMMIQTYIYQWYWY